MEMDIKIKLPEKIEQSFIDCVELQYGEKFSQQVKKTFSQRMCQDNKTGGILL